uniref:Uncharacterized protein n=1 Tax=Cannabis sativa TaxID=3483 RepID=A0A803PM16_CANSA
MFLAQGSQSSQLDSESSPFCLWKTLVVSFRRIASSARIPSFRVPSKTRIACYFFSKRFLRSSCLALSFCLKSAGGFYDFPPLSPRFLVHEYALSVLPVLRASILPYDLAPLWTFFIWEIRATFLRILSLLVSFKEGCGVHLWRPF